MMRIATRVANAGYVYVSALRAGWADYRSLYTWKSWLFGWVVRIVSQVAFFAVIGHLLGSPERIEFLLIGSAVAIALMETLMAMSFMSAERAAGTLPLVVATPSSPVVVLAGRTAFLIATGTVSASIALFTTALLFGISLPWHLAWAIVMLVAVVAIASHCLALLVTSVAIKALRFGTLLNGLTFVPMLALCGAVVPVTFWPQWIQYLSNVLPLTHGLAGVRAIVDGGSIGVAAASAGWELAVGAGWLILAALMLRWFVYRARRVGDLDHAQ